MSGRRRAAPHRPVSLPGGGEPAGPGVPQAGGLPVPVGVPLPPEHRPDGLLLPGASPQPHQLPGDLHDQRRALLRVAAHLRQHGDVPHGAAAVPARQSVPLHLRLLGRVRHVPGDRGGRAGARLADLLQQEAAGPVVHGDAGEEEEMSAGGGGEASGWFPARPRLVPDSRLNLVTQVTTDPPGH